MGETPNTIKTKKAYRAWMYVDHQGARVWCHEGTVSPCGEWVEIGDVRHRRTDEWFDTIAQARASKASEVANMGTRMLEQAKQLLDAATSEVAS